jgi:uncharacterized LabA/DUF88 family protein
MARNNRLILFIDSQNVYKNARDAYFKDNDHHIFGQVNPLAFGQLICQKTIPVAPILHQVRIYCGQPDASKEPRTYAANYRQRNVWAKMGVFVVSRPLRYPQDWPKSKAQEKGVDVALAVDFVTMAVNGEYDIGVIASTDTDLKPALEFVYRHFLGKIRIAVAAWRSDLKRSRLSIEDSKIWCHYINRDDFEMIKDLTDFNLSS